MATQYTAGLSAGQVLTAGTMNSIGAAWESWTPQLWQGANITSTITYAKYTRINKLVICNFHISATAAGTAANQIQIRSLPITAANQSSIVGVASYLDAGAAWYNLTAEGISTTSIAFITYNQGNFFGIAPAITVANTDYIKCSITYEAA